MATRIYVGNLSYDTSAEQLRDLFGQAGAVRDVHLPTDRSSGQPRGFAFVEMETKEDADTAIQRFNGYALGGRELRVNEAREREERGRSTY